MAASHPPSLLTHVARSLRGECATLRGARVLVAASGGVDSQVLLHALAWHRAKHGLELVAHGVDHGLRAQAGAELDLAEELARSLAIPFARTALTLAPGGNLQARAREARFETLRAAAHAAGARYIATAHHADDRAETVILRLLRGAGPRGLAVLPPIAGDLARPMLRASRADILAHADCHHLRFASDSSNQDPRFTRVRVRREVLPLLADLDPAIVRHLCDLADRLRTLEPEEAPEGPTDDDCGVPPLPAGPSVTKV